MNAKTYWAKTMGEALSEVKRDLGRQAVILHTRRVRRGGFLKLFGRQKLWEVTASPNANVPGRGGEGEYVPELPPPVPAADVHDVDEAAFDELVEAVVGEAAQTPAPTVAERDLAREVSSLRHLIEAIAARANPTMTAAPAPAGAGPTGVYGRLRERLIEQDVELPIADELIRQVQEEFGPSENVDDVAVTERLRSLIARCIVVGPPAPARESNGRARVVVLIGPTGVGKTTTIAKLAAAAALRQRLKVAMVTMDTYRIAAVEQLRTYAEIIGVPLHAVLTPEELRETVELLRDHDLVLIDTAGRSQNDRVRLSHLGKFVQAAGADEVHLVVAATASSRCVRQVMTNFAPLGANRVILTKLDEADSLGVVLNVSAAAGVPLSYVTTGQEVPDDIEVVDANRLADRLLGGVHAA
ncbi:MAG: flagellar biosynthesis protein FlhF [Planctomycetota bacterium]|nr:flagellar biosynthesis protein FlhF [Planctomycetota bacterium]